MSRARKRRGKQRSDQAPRQASRQAPRKHRRGPGGKGATTGTGVEFWGDSAKLPAPRQSLRITDDPAATVRSLGPPPLPGHEEIAGHYFTAVYDRAVAIAGALAAVGGLIEPEELQERDEG